MGDSQASEKKGGSRKSPIRDARGAVAVYVAIVAPVLFGVGALTLDVGRLITLHTELQAAADGAAIAGARELTRFPGAIEKAREAAAEALRNIQTFATGSKQAILDKDDLKRDCSDSDVPQVSGAPALGAPCIRFLKSLPANDQVSIDDNSDADFPHVTTLDEEARFIDVHIGARDVTNILVRLLMLMGQSPLVTSTTSATAVAGQDQLTCKTPPMFLCNPTEPLLNKDETLPLNFEMLKTPSGRNRELRLFLQGGGGAMTPGNMGLLCPIGAKNCGAKNVKDALASKEGTCVGTGLVVTKTGDNLGPVIAGINARFDHFEPQAFTSDGNIPWRELDGTLDADGKRTPDFTPAANVTQGRVPPNTAANSQTKCEYDEPKKKAKNLNADGQTKAEWVAAGNDAKDFEKDHTETAMGFPPDKCFIPGSSTYPCSFGPGGSDRVGDADWAYREYWRINHSCNLPTTATDCRPGDWPVGAPWPPSRFDVYRYEIETYSNPPTSIVKHDQDIYDKNDGSLPPGKTAEDGRAECFKGDPPELPIPSADKYFPDMLTSVNLLRDRRVIPIAIANCYAIDASPDNSTSGKFEFVVPEYIFVFLNTPMGDPGSPSVISAEVLGALDVEAKKNLLKDIVQIYRRGR